MYRITYIAFNRTNVIHYTSCRCDQYVFLSHVLRYTFVTRTAIRHERVYLTRTRHCKSTEYTPRSHYRFKMNCPSFRRNPCPAAILLKYAHSFLDMWDILFIHSSNNSSCVFVQISADKLCNKLRVGPRIMPYDRRKTMAVDHVQYKIKN